MKLSVIIPALQEAPRIAVAIESAWRAGASEVVVADGGSQDGTSEVSQAAGATVVACEPGRGKQLAAGASASCGEILLFLHADSRLSETVGAQLEELAKQRQEFWGCFRQKIEGESLAYRALEWGNAMRAVWWRLAYGDQAIFVTRELYQRFGGFAAVPLMEDVMLSQQLAKVCRPIFLPGPVHTSSRRWEKHGIVRQTLRNWGIMIRYFWGVAPEDLAKLYRRHDK